MSKIRVTQAHVCDKCEGVFLEKNILMSAHNLEKNSLVIAKGVFSSIFLFGRILIQIIVMGWLTTFI